MVWVRSSGQVAKLHEERAPRCGSQDLTAAGDPEARAALHHAHVHREYGGRPRGSGSCVRGPRGDSRPAVGGSDGSRRGAQARRAGAPCRQRRAGPGSGSGQSGEHDRPLVVLLGGDALMDQLSGVARVERGTGRVDRRATVVARARTVTGGPDVCIIETRLIQASLDRSSA